MSSWDIKEVFNKAAFLKEKDKTSDFYKDFLMTRTWMIFIEEKIMPNNISQIQTQKQFDKWVSHLEEKQMYAIPHNFFTEEVDEESEVFEFYFSPIKYADKTKLLQEWYIDTEDINGVKIDRCIKTVEIQV